MTEAQWERYLRLEADVHTLYHDAYGNGQPGLFKELTDFLARDVERTRNEQGRSDELKKGQEEIKKQVEELCKNRDKWDGGRATALWFLAVIGAVILVILGAVVERAAKASLDLHGPFPHHSLSQPLIEASKENQSADIYGP